MVIGFNAASTRRFGYLIAPLLLVAVNTASAGDLDEKKTDQPAVVTTSDAKSADTDTDGKADSKTAEEKDPFVLPENADVEELFHFVRSVKRARGRTLESVTKAARAVVAGTEAIRNREDVKTEDEIKAIREQLVTLSFLCRFYPKTRKQKAALMEELSNDVRPEIAVIGDMERFKGRIDSAKEATAQEQREMIGDLKNLLAGLEFDRQAYALTYGLARAIGYSDSSEVAASLYEDMSEMMSQSRDASLRERASKMMGAARRMRLPGNFMEVMGQTTGGEELDWNQYRGKVVLVDFWASWCAPCRGEVPNMKRNLAIYRNRGFDIVGVNLDKSLEACEKYVQQEELQWVNLMSEENGKRGWNNPLATRYGISEIPTAILVDQEGKVVSLRARGEELDRLLLELLGKPEPIETVDGSESQPGQKVAEN